MKGGRALSTLGWVRGAGPVCAGVAGEGEPCVEPTLGQV